MKIRGTFFFKCDSCRWKSFSPGDCSVQNFPERLEEARAIIRIQV